MYVDNSNSFHENASGGPLPPESDRVEAIGARRGVTYDLSLPPRPEKGFALYTFKQQRLQSKNVLLALEKTLLV